jgi:hypothetical protein
LEAPISNPSNLSTEKFVVLAGFGMAAVDDNKLVYGYNESPESPGYLKEEAPTFAPRL